MIVMILAGVMAAAFWVDYLFEQRLRRMEARKRHPSHYCDDCAMQVEDWKIHNRLAHGLRVRAPEDSW